MSGGTEGPMADFERPSVPPLIASVRRFAAGDALAAPCLRVSVANLLFFVRLRDLRVFVVGPPQAKSKTFSFLHMSFEHLAADDAAVDIALRVDADAFGA
jgi:hypothetical protein